MSGILDSAGLDMSALPIGSVAEFLKLSCKMADWAAKATARAGLTVYGSAHARDTLTGNLPKSPGGELIAYVPGSPTRTTCGHEALLWAGVRQKVRTPAG